MRSRALRLPLLAASLAAVLSCAPQPEPPPPPVSQLPFKILDQGPSWTERDRFDFYKQDQGSQIMRLAWMQALKLPDGAPLITSLGRYGYLPNQEPTRLPVGFTSANLFGENWVGMTCAACHTRQIQVGGTPYRIDGGPALVNFGQFMLDLQTAFRSVATNEQAFAAFAQQVLGPNPAPVALTALRQQVADWWEGYDALVTKALPPGGWGMGRLDAVGMIFNRVTGLDIGFSRNHLMVENIKRADAPVRYPFLWNSWRQDRTEWAGFAPNGEQVLGLVRNLGEVYGVFASFKPVRSPRQHPILKVDYLNQNSANFDGLLQAERLVTRIGPPQWPWPVDAQLAQAGKAIYERPTAAGGCIECHRVKQTFTLGEPTWDTPVQNVGTDTRQHEVLEWTSRTGQLEGASLLGGSALQPEDSVLTIASTAVGGSILQRYFSPNSAAEQAARPEAAESRQAGISQPRRSDAAVQTQSANIANNRLGAPVRNGYESRVLFGIWAAAPYLHNGSVPTLADLLNPAESRPASFWIGPAYDTDKVGLAGQQPAGATTVQTTGCSDLNSGNSRCGHEFGVALSATEKQALLEYLKRL